MMERRLFVKTSLLTGSLPAMIQTAAYAEEKQTRKAAREYYELRIYTLKNDAQQQLVQDYYKHAAIPAYNKMGIKNIGVFTELKPEGQTKLYVLLSYNSTEDIINMQDKLMKDSTYVTAAGLYLNAPASAPAYNRIESMLLLAFPDMPKMEIPANKQRIFELRRYESPGEAASKKKLEMFNQGGEIPIFRKTGLKPVFFGESLIGENRPNLTYMIAFDDMDAHDKAWKAFGSDPDWGRLKAIPEYADAKIISKIVSTFLVPADFSQV